MMMRAQHKLEQLCGSPMVNLSDGGPHTDQLLVLFKSWREMLRGQTDSRGRRNRNDGESVVIMLGKCVCVLPDEKEV